MEMIDSTSSCRKIDTPCGILLLFAYEGKINTVRWARGDDGALLSRSLRESDRDKEILDIAGQAVEDYFKGKPIPVELSLEFMEEVPITDFSQRVFRELVKVPYGETVTYRDLAHRTGCPGSARIIGNMMAANRLVLFVPCHRVVRSDGTVGGYCGKENRVDIKEYLLKKENYEYRRQDARSLGQGCRRQRGETQ